MNIRQRKFAELVAQGVLAGAAYEKAGYETSGQVSHSAGQRLLNHVEVQKHIKLLTSKSEKKTILNRDQIRKFYSDLIGDKGAKASDRLKASDLLNKMDQNYAPKMVEVIDNRPVIAERVRLVGPLIADKIGASQPDTVDV